MERIVYRPAGCLSDFAIDRLIVGELDDIARSATLDHAAACASCARRISELRGEHEHFATRPLPLFLGRRRRTVLGASAVLVAAALAVVVAMPPDEPNDPVAPEPISDVVRTKGGDHLGLYLERDGQFEPLLSGERIAPGARVQLTYTAAGPGYLAIFGVDGVGKVQRHYPGEAHVHTGAFVHAGHDEALPLSLAFDATPGHEVLLAVFCPQLIDTAVIERQIADGSAPSAGPTCTIDRIELLKSDP